MRPIFLFCVRLLIQISKKKNSVHYKKRRFRFRQRKSKKYFKLVFFLYDILLITIIFSCSNLSFNAFRLVSKSVYCQASSNWETLSNRQCLHTMSGVIVQLFADNVCRLFTDNVVCWHLTVSLSLSEIVIAI